MNFSPKSKPITGTGRLARKSRESERADKRLRSYGYGVTSGPLGTSQAYLRKGTVSRGVGRDTWAA